MFSDQLIRAMELKQDIISIWQCHWHASQTASSRKEQFCVWYFYPIAVMRVVPNTMLFCIHRAHTAHINQFLLLLDAHNLDFPISINNKMERNCVQNTRVERVTYGTWAYFKNKACITECTIHFDECGCFFLPHPHPSVNNKWEWWWKICVLCKLPGDLRV